MKKNYLLTIILLFTLIIQISAQSYVYKRTVTSPNRNDQDVFGTTIEMNDNFISVSSPGHSWNEDDEDYVLWSGALFMNTYDQFGNMQPHQKIVSPDRTLYEAFGIDQTFSGNQIIAGASGYDELLDTTLNQGAAFVYKLENDVWTLSQKIIASDRSEEDAFGKKLSASGGKMVICAPLEDHNELGTTYLSNSGSAYIFQKDSNGNWWQTQKIVASDRSQGDEFGSAVHIDNDKIIFGAPRNENDAAGSSEMTDAGAVYIFENLNDSLFEQTTKLVASDRFENDQFGTEVVISGNYAFASSPLKTIFDGGDTIVSAGVVYFFQKEFPGTWVEKQKITSPDPSNNAFFGLNISTEDDVLTIGAQGESFDVNGQNELPGAGAIYIYKKNTDGVWVFNEKLVSTTRQAQDNFGFEVKIKDQLLFTGIPSEDEDANGENYIMNAGAVAVYKTCTNESTLIEATICEGAIYEFGSQMLYEAGNYNEIYPMEGGCEFSVDLILSVQEINSSINVDGNILTVSQNNANIQWINCDNNEIIVGATSESFTATSPGNYAAQIQVGSCQEISDCVNVTSVGIGELNHLELLSAYPNPFEDKISISSVSEAIHASLVDITGKVVSQMVATPENNTLIIEGINPGIYMLKLKSASAIKVLKMIKK